MSARATLIAVLESKRCALSTDGGGKESTHYVKDGACVICDLTVRQLVALHGVAA